MKRIHLLTEGFVTPGSRAFLYPLLVYRAALQDAGFLFRIFTRIEPELYDCDVLGVDSKFHLDLLKREQTGLVVDDFAKFRDRVKDVYYFETVDSTSWDQTIALPYVTKYLKGQLLRDRSRYLKPLYGQRIFTDYYHQRFGVNDARPSFSQAIASESDLKKLGVFWNSSLADYSEWGPSRMALYHRIPVGMLLGCSRRWTDPARERPLAVNCRMGTRYSRETVAWQRQEVRKLLAGSVPADKVGRLTYFRELKDSQVVVAPFGFGEFTYKDYETFLTGGMLFKPDMSHMETWPDLYRDGETYLSFKWDLSDFQQKLEGICGDRKERLAIATAGQENYRKYLDPESSRDHFLARIREVFK